MAHFWRLIPRDLKRLPVRETQRMTIFAARALKPDSIVPDTIEQIRAKKQRIADREAVIKGRGYALPDEK